MLKLMRFIFVMLFLVSGINSVFAQSEPVSFVTAAEKEEVYTDEQGVERTRLVPVATVIPGDRIIYTITFANNGKETVKGINIVDPIPEHMRYVPESAFGPGTTISFSADGGKNYASAEQVEIVDTNGNSRRASPDEYTHIRWKLMNELEPGTQAYAQFKAVLR